MASINTRRVYEPHESGDGQLVLVDRLWPRGLSKATLKGVTWLKEIAPSNDLRKWYHAHPDEHAEFKKRYKAELKKNPEAVAELRALTRKGRTTLLYASKDIEHNNADVLAEFLKK